MPGLHTATTLASGHSIGPAVQQFIMEWQVENYVVEQQALHSARPGQPQAHRLAARL